MFKRATRTRTRTGAGAAVLLAAALGLGGAGMAQAEAFAPTAETAQRIAELTLRGAAYADALRDRAIRLLGGAHVADRRLGGSGVDATIRTASTARKIPELPAGRSTQAKGVFGSVAIAFRRLPAVEKIAPARAEFKRSALLRCADRACAEPQKTLETALRAAGDRPLLRKAKAVNAQVNAYVAYRRDADTYGVIDYWATPQEILKRRAGDCEDYAILKMALLRELGVAETDMAVVVLRDERRGVYHAVLSLRTASGHLILDNVRDDILSDRELPHYLPLYSVSAGKGFIHGRKSGSSPVQMSSLSFDSVAPGEGPDPVTAADLRPGF